MYFLHCLTISSIFLALPKHILAQSDLRCYQCENCPDQGEHLIIKCHEGNVITSTTESDTTIETTEFVTNSYFNDDGDELEESEETNTDYIETEDPRFDLDLDDYESQNVKEEEIEFVCFMIVVEDSKGTFITNRGCAIKLQQDNDTCALANVEKNEPVSCEICAEELCNGGNASAPANLLRALMPIFIIFLLTE